MTSWCYTELALGRQVDGVVPVTGGLTYKCEVRISALFRHCFNGDFNAGQHKLENFGEFQRSMKSILKLNDWHQSSSNG